MGTSVFLDDKKDDEDVVIEAQEKSRSTNTPMSESDLDARDKELDGLSGRNDVEGEDGGEAGGVGEMAVHKPPDGGLHAWLKVFGGFLIYINIWGFTIAFGCFQSYYSFTLLPTHSSSQISWIGTVQGWLLITVGVLSGPLFDLGYFRPMLFAGNFLVVFGTMMLSLCTRYWQVFLAQGVCMGLGAGLLYIPSLALVGVWFERRRAVAMGIVMSGIAVGGVTYILIFDRLVPRVGFPWTIRVMGFISLSASVLSFPALLSGTPPSLLRSKKARALFDPSALRDPLFIMFTMSSFFTFLGYIVPYFYIPTFARQKLGSSDSTALYMLVVAVASSFFGRLGSGVLAHWLGSIFTWMLCGVCSGVLGLVWVKIENESGMIGFAVVWGFFSAGLVTLPGAAFATICPDLSLLGTRLGMSWGASSIATLIGAPIAGALLRAKNHGAGGDDASGAKEADFQGVSIWSGVTLLFGSLCIAALWIGVVRNRGRDRGVWV